MPYLRHLGNFQREYRLLCLCTSPMDLEVEELLAPMQLGQVRLELGWVVHPAAE